MNPKLLVVSPWGREVELYHHLMMQSLAGEGFELFLAAPPGRDFFPDPGTYTLLPCFPHPGASTSRWRRLPGYMGALGRLTAWCERNRPAVIHLSTLGRPLLDLLPIHLWRIRGARIVQTVHDVEPLQPHVLRDLSRGLVFRAADRLVVHTPGALVQVESHLGAGARSKTRFIPHGDFTALARWAPENPERARVELGLPPGAPVVLFFGSLLPYKGLDTLLSAWPRVRLLHPGAILVLAGSSRERGVPELLPDSGIRLQDEFIPVQRIPTLFRAADVVALPYHRSSVSGVLIMAQSLERPVVASDLPALRWSVEAGGRPGGAGLLVPPGDAGALAEALATLLSDGPGSRIRGQNGHTFLLETSSWQKVGPMLAALYRELVRSG